MRHFVSNRFPVWISALFVCFLMLAAGVCASAEESTILTSGYCGDQTVNGIRNGNLSYRLDSRGRLTVSGTGKMGYLFHGPWHAQRSRILSVQIEEGVTSIGSYAFHGCENLISISIPDSVATIESNAFSGCSSLKSIHIPDSVWMIGDFAFNSCTSLKSIMLPETVTKIGSSAFSRCSNLAFIGFPDGITAIDSYTFYSCSSLKHLFLPDGLTEIGDVAFYGCRSLESIRIPSGVTTIGNSAFYGCRSLTSIHIPAGAAAIGDYAFDGCKALKHFLLPVEYVPAYEVGSSASTIIYCYSDSAAAHWAEENGYQIVSLNNLDTAQTLTFSLYARQTALAPGESATLIPVLFPDQANPVISWTSSDPGIITVQDGTVIARADGLASVTASCGGRNASIAFYVSAALASFRPEENGDLLRIDSSAFGGSQLKTILLSENCTEIGSRAFENNTELEMVYLSSGIVSIADDAFDGCGKFVITGEPYSTAAEYAAEKNIPFFTRIPNH